MSEPYRITRNPGDMIACRRNALLGSMFLDDPWINETMLVAGAARDDEAPFPTITGVRWDLDELETRFRSLGERLLPAQRSAVRRALDEQRFGQD
jgi:hypothetical protein